MRGDHLAAPTRVDTQLYTRVDSPIGELLLLSDGRALRGLHMQDGRRPTAIGSGWEPSTGPFADVRAQLGEYFAGRRTEFDLALRMDGTPFQLRVWQALRNIGYGETASYAEIARRIGKPGSARAVGLANGRNPIAVIVPCHRVIGADGTLTGYGGGIERKRRLLDLEAGTPALAPPHAAGADTCGDGRPVEAAAAADDVPAAATAC